MSRMFEKAVVNEQFAKQMEAAQQVRDVNAVPSLSQMLDVCIDEHERLANAIAALEKRLELVTFPRTTDCVSSRDIVNAPVPAPCMSTATSALLNITERIRASIAQIERIQVNLNL